MPNVPNQKRILYEHFLLICITVYGLFNTFSTFLQHPSIAQVAVIGIEDSLKGQLPLALYVTKSGVAHDEEVIGKELVDMVRKDVGAVAAFRLSLKVPDLPRTRSGKIPRKSMAELASGKDVKVQKS